MKLFEAEALALDLVESMRPHCLKIEICGSIRRHKATVKDIEIVAVPRWEEIEVADGLFDTKRVPFNPLYHWLMCDSGIRWIHKHKGAVLPAQPAPCAKMMKGLLPSGAQLDLFLPRLENFGAIQLIRTGSADFSQAVMIHAKKIGRPCVDGFFTISGLPVETPEEINVFEMLGLRYVEPQLRVDGRAVKAER